MRKRRKNVGNWNCFLKQKVFYKAMVVNLLEKCSVDTLFLAINDRAHLGEDNATDESAKKEVEMNSVLPETSLGQVKCS